MTDYEINVPGNLLSSLLSDKNGLGHLVEAILNQILDAQASNQVGAGRYKPSDERVVGTGNNKQSPRVGDRRT